MRVLIFTFFCLFMALPVQAWNTVDHKMSPRLALKSLIPTAKLDQTVPYEPLSGFLNKLSKVHSQIQTEKDLYQWLMTHPQAPFEKKNEILSKGTPVLPLEILSQYASAPDDKWDQDLSQIGDEVKRRKISKKMFWFGSLSGVGSQAFRHIEKPPFDLSHPLETFGFPLTTVGEATKRAEIFYVLALLADRLESPYWAWRFLSCSFHYLQDLHNPHHATQISPQLLWAGVMAYVQWGYEQDKGFLKTIGHVGSNVHNFLESWLSSYTGSNYVKYLQGERLSIPLSTRLLLRSLEGESTLKIGDFRSLIIGVRDQSNLQSLKLTNYVLDLTKAHLFGPREFPSGASSPDSVRDFMALEVLKDKDRYEAPLWPLLRERFQAMGESLRQVVLFFNFERIQKKDVKVLLDHINALLAD